MIRVNLFFALFFMIGSAYSQTILILNSGRTFPYTTLEAQPDYLDVWPSLEKGVLQIDIDSVKGYYKLDTDKDILKIKLPDHSEGSELNYQFLPYGLRGRINSYRYPVPFATEGDVSSMYLYLEKDGNTKLLFPYSFGTTKEKSIDDLKSLVEDEPSILSKIEASDYEHNLKNVDNLIAEYNLLTYKKLAGPEDEMAIITFYRMKKGESKEPFKLTLDGEEHQLNHYNIRNIKVSTENLQKLCALTPESEKCLLIEGLSYFRVYYQVSLDKKGNTRFIRREKRDAFTDIKVIRGLN